MKKYLPGLLLLLFSCVDLHAQSISFSDLITLVNLKKGEACDYLTDGRVFKKDYTEEAAGGDLVHFGLIDPHAIQENVVVGKYFKITGGKVLHSIFYSTSQPKYMGKFMFQARQDGLALKFRGANSEKKIYILENFLYDVTINIGSTNVYGSIEVKQKRLLEIH